MAQKASKTIAQRNAGVLKQTHLTTLGLHLLFLFLTFILGRPHNLLAYILLSSPTLLISLYLERIGRPRYADNGILKSPGDDLYSEGAMTYLWDVLYWTWGCMIMVIALGDELWWLWVIVPLYTLYALYDAFIGMKKSMGGMGGAGDGDGDYAGAGAGASTGSSRRQQKLERRGEQKVRYRS